jgi:hypothetical protein
MSRFFPGSVKNGIDESFVEGQANAKYGIPNFLVEYALTEAGIPVGFWRSVGNSHNGFITECFVEELAKAAGKDPFEFRRKLLANAPRHRGVLELAAEKAGWGTPLPAGRTRGIAVVESFGSFAAEVAEVSVNRSSGEVRVHRVVCAIDCGRYVNPDTIAAQMEGCIVFGLTAALKGQITIARGRVEQSNFHDYEMLRLNESPRLKFTLWRATNLLVASASRVLRRLLPRSATPFSQPLASPFADCPSALKIWRSSGPSACCRMACAPKLHLHCCSSFCYLDLLAAGARKLLARRRRRHRGGAA